MPYFSNASLSFTHENILVFETINVLAFMTIIFFSSVAARPLSRGQPTLKRTAQQAGPHVTNTLSVRPGDSVWNF